jgi:ribonuclease P protein component
VNSGPAARETFSRGDRLRKRREFEECYASGVRVSGRYLQIFLRPAPDPPRLGISVPRRVGNAATRNRVRRRLREIFRRNRCLFASRPACLVVHARPAAAAAAFEDLAEEYRRAVTRGLAR